MKWLTNMYNPYRHDAKERVTCGPGETLTEAWERQRQFLDGKIIGSPMATEDTAELATLKRLGVVGIYEAEESTDD